MTFSNATFRPAQQGQLDGFCGIYTIVNFVSRRLTLERESDQQKDVFRRLLWLLKKQEKLTPHRICNGFLEEQLQKAFNRLATERGLGAKAYAIEPYAKKVGAKTVHDILRTLKIDEAAMIHMDEHNHWVLAHSASQNDRYVVDDSSEEPKPVQMTATKTKNAKIGIKSGLVFLNAQTH